MWSLKTLKTTCNDYFNKSAHGYILHKCVIMSCINHFPYPFFFNKKRGKEAMQRGDSFLYGLDLRSTMEVTTGSQNILREVLATS